MIICTPILCILQRSSGNINSIMFFRRKKLLLQIVIYRTEELSTLINLKECLVIRATLQKWISYGSVNNMSLMFSLIDLCMQLIELFSANLEKPLKTKCCCKCLYLIKYVKTHINNLTNRSDKYHTNLFLNI